MRTATAWPGWLGAVVLLAAVYVPPILAADSLAVALGNVTVQVGALLASIPGLALVGLVAPLTGRRRRSALVAIVPIWGWGRVVEIGYVLALLVQTRASTVVEVSDVDQTA